MTEITIPTGTDVIRADVGGVDRLGTIVFAHGSGSSRHSSRNRHVAGWLQEAGFRTVLVDLLTEWEESSDFHSLEHRFDVELLTERVLASVAFLREGGFEGPLGLFGASTGPPLPSVPPGQSPKR